MGMALKNAEIAQKFVADLAAVNVTLPLRCDEENIGTIYDANGIPVCVVDVNRERPDIEAGRIALWIILAVNACGGFKLEQAR